MVIYNPLSGLL